MSFYFSIAVSKSNRPVCYSILCSVMCAVGECFVRLHYELQIK